jgi:hypothetical protein
MLFEFSTAKLCAKKTFLSEVENYFNIVIRCWLPLAERSTFFLTSGFIFNIL